MGMLHKVFRNRRSRSSVEKILVLSLLVVLAGCGGLQSEPEIIATIPPPTPEPQDLGYPRNAPDLALGAEIYAANCTECHGIDGGGNGELVQSGEVPVMTSFRDPETARNQTPAEWFDTITNGRIENLMPPWRNALTEEERWAVALYTYTLAYTPEQLADGETIYNAECADCHGLTGVGDGERAVELTRPVGDLTDQIEQVSLSDQVVYTIVTEGQGSQMPAYADELSDDQRWAVTAYTRSLALTNIDAPNRQVEPPAETPEATAETEAAAAELTITGSVINGTATGTVPDDLTVSLRLFDPQMNMDVFEQPLAEDRSFSFEDVPRGDDLRYIVTVPYRDRIFSSEVAIAESGSLELPITIYEFTEDPEVIQITRMATQIQALGDGLQMTQVILFENTSDRLYTTSQALEDGRFASVAVSLPPGGVVVGFGAEQDRYLFVAEDSLVVDTAPVLPGEEHLVQLTYFVPYQRGAVIEQPVNYVLDGAVRVLIPGGTVNATSEQLEMLEPETLDNTTYTVLGSDLSLQPGEAISYELSGDVGAAGIANATGRQSSPTFLFGLLGMGIGLAVVLVGVVIFMTRRRESPRADAEADSQLTDALVRQIAELDDDFAAGEIDETAYQTQRDRLKARLAELMQRTQDD